VAALAPNRVGEDISVRATACPRWCAASGPSPEKYKFTIAVFGTQATANLHPSVLCDLSNREEAERVHQAVEEIFKAALAVGGTLSGEHASPPPSSRTSP